VLFDDLDLEAVGFVDIGVVPVVVVVIASGSGPGQTDRTEAGRAGLQCCMSRCSVGQADFVSQGIR
jgi:hypothetical protein